MMLSANKFLEADMAKKQFKAESKKLLDLMIHSIYTNKEIFLRELISNSSDALDKLYYKSLSSGELGIKRNDFYIRITPDKELRTLTIRDNGIGMSKEELEKDRAAQEPLEKKAREARLAMEDKVEAQQALIEQMKYDKATIERKQDEARAASERITRMLQRSGLRNLPVQGSGAMLWPLAGEITSDFGWRTHPISGAQSFHSGIDIGGDYGEPIYAAQAGTVEYAGWISGYGNAVIINHGGGISTLYGHCQALLVSTGQSVAQGELIAECGSTGNSTGPHCHFEVRVNGEPVNPLGYL